MTSGLWYLIKIALAIALAVWLAQQPGTVAITWRNYQLETTIGFMALALLLLMGVAALLYHAWRKLVRATDSIASWRQKGQRNQGYSALREGFIALSKGDHKAAMRHGEAAAKKLDDPALGQLLTGQAAALSGDSAKERAAFVSLARHEDTALLGWRGLVEQALRQGDLRQARQLATRARDIAPNNQWALTTLFDLQVRTQKWLPALDTLKRAKAAGAFPDGVAERHEMAIDLAQSAEAEAAGHLEEAQRLAERAHKLTPGFAPTAVMLSRHLAAAGKQKAALRLVEAAWKERPHPDLARRYAKLAGSSEGGGDNALHRLEAMQSLEKLDLGLVDGHLEVALAALDAGRLEVAEAELAPLREAGVLGRRGWRLVGRLEGARGNAQAAADAWRRALESPPDPAWVCGACGSLHGQWTPLCGACGSFNTVDWRVPAGAVHRPRGGLLAAS